MEFTILLQYLGKLLGQETLELNDNGVLGLRFGKDLDIQIEPDPDGVHGHLYGTLCPLPADPVHRLRLMEAVLSANAFGRGTSRASFSLDEHSGEILLGKIFACQKTEPQELHGFLVDLVGTLKIWRTRLHDLTSMEAAPASGNSEDAFIRP